MTFDENKLYIGTFKSSVQDRWLSLSQPDRRRHMYAIGQTGSGKSTLLGNCILQDVLAGRGFAFIDPHGDSAEQVIDSIPKFRIRDVVYFNPSDTDFPLGFNPLRGVPDHLKAVATANLIATFRSIWRESWGPRMEHILSNTISALMEYPDNIGISLLAIPKMLTEERFRRRVLRHVNDPIVLTFWQNEFAAYNERQRAEVISPILNKIGAFARNPAMRNILGQSKNTFDLSYIMDNRKILVVNLSKGVLGEDMTNLLGSLLVCAIQQEVMKRASVSEDDRVDFHLYIDEFQNFTTDAFDSIVSEARKYRLSLIIAHQYLSQLSETVRKAILGNVGNLVMFTLGGGDAETFSIESKPFNAQTLREQARGDMLVRYIEDGISKEPERVSGVVLELRTGSKQAVINNSRTRFGKPRTKVEDKINRWLTNHAYD
jgi:type IV secretory pathway TraG/TraD family ATPase VirD4